MPVSWAFFAFISHFLIRISYAGKRDEAYTCCRKLRVTCFYSFAQYSW